MRTMVQHTTDCPPAPQDEHPRLTSFLAAMAMAGSPWHPGAALAAQMLRRQLEADCEDERGAAL
jgi:hypothetical protein